MDLKSILHTDYITREQGEYLLNALINDPSSWEEFLKWDEGKPSIIASTILKLMRSRNIEQTEENYLSVAGDIMTILIEKDFRKLRKCNSPECFWSYFSTVINRAFCYLKKRKGEAVPSPNKILSKYVNNNNQVLEGEIPDSKDDSTDVFEEVANREMQRIQHELLSCLNALDMYIFERAFFEEEDDESIARYLYDKRLISCQYEPPSQDWLDNIRNNVYNRKCKAKKKIIGMLKSKI